MYSEEAKETKDGVELTIDFGKNMMGLSDELITIGNKINELSKENRILLLDAFCDPADDVYQFKFILIPNVKGKDGKLPESTRNLLTALE